MIPVYTMADNLGQRGTAAPRREVPNNNTLLKTRVRTLNTIGDCVFGNKKN